MKYAVLYPLIPSAFLLLLTACDETAEGDEDLGNENTEAMCMDSLDNDDDGAVDCSDAKCLPFEHCSQSSEIPEVVEADISGMPIPPQDDLLRPEGAMGNLQILSWAGFKAALTYSFDDTHPSHIEHYDTLNSTGVRMTFFAVNETATDIEGWRQAVTDGHEIGNHTVHHCHSGLDECAWGEALESAEAEIGECSNYIVQNFGQAGVWTMASPYGEYWWSMYAKEYVFLNRSVTAGTIAPNDDSTPLNLPSVMLDSGIGASTIIEDIDAAHGAGEWLIFCLHAILPTEDTSSGGIHINAITDSIAHGKALQDLWIDSMVNIGAYWIGQMALMSAPKQTAGNQTFWTWTLPDHFPPGRFLRVTVDGGTLSQGGRELPWSAHGYYEVALDTGELTLSP